MLQLRSLDRKAVLKQRKALELVRLSKAGKTDIPR